MTSFACKILHTHAANKARVTEITTPHGTFITPSFMPVGTRAGVNNLTPKELIQTNSQIILGGNTYHMLDAPGMAVIQSVGGMHPFMGWKGPMLTDSGGFQVFSLSKNKDFCRIDEQGAHFKLPTNDSLIHMTPELSLQTQKIIGADIIMAFDQCTSDDYPYEEVQQVMQRTHRWLNQSLEYHHKCPDSLYGYKQALFGIVQGGIYQDLRCQSAELIGSMELDGIAIGGETIGFNMQRTVDILQWIEPYLPKNKPRYSMGVGMSPQDLLEVVACGVDMFDCVAPTRNARHGALYCGKIVEQNNWLKFESCYENQRIQIKKSCFAKDSNPIMADCQCYTCSQYTRAYLHHLFKQKAPQFTALASIHNIHVMQEVCNKMRNFISNASAKLSKISKF